jgi:ketosteroid isomerase-like protein
MTKRILVTMALALAVISFAHAQTTTDAGFRAFLNQFEDARTRYINGDARAWKELLSTSADATVMGASGGVTTGPDVVARYEAAAGRLTPTGNKIQVYYVATGVSGDLAYAITIERSTVQAKDQPSNSVEEQRATNIFQRENGSWKLLHRHVDSLTQPTASTPAVTAAPAPSPVNRSAASSITLKYNPPAGFYRSASTPPESYSSNTVNGGVQIYPFRPFNGDVAQMFQRTLLREWIDPQFVETQVLGPPQFTRQQMPGASNVVTAHFPVAGTGGAVDRVRILVVAGNQAALVDINANSTYSFQQMAPTMQALMASMRVETVTAPPPLSPAATRGISGIYMGLKNHYVVNLIVGGGSSRMDPHFYMLSSTGRVYRTFDPVSAQDADRFDYDSAQRRDPESSGYYTVQGDQLVIEIGGPTPETLRVPIPRGSMTIDRVTYTRE